MLASVVGVPVGNVDLIAPQGIVDAGDAGIRVTGNLNIAATAVLNASNIQAGGSSAGVPASPTVAAPSLGAVTQPQQQPPGGDAAQQAREQQQREATQQQVELPSLITVQVLGYGEGEIGPDEDEEKKKREQAAEAAVP